MTSNGYDIRQYPLSRPPVNIATSLFFELEQARLSYGMTPAEFEALPGNPEWAGYGKLSKAHVLVSYRLTALIGAVESEARAKASERH